MQKANSPSKVAQPFDNVKACFAPNAIPSSDSMIHHNHHPQRDKEVICYSRIYRERRYGVSRQFRILSPQLFLKKFDLVRDCLEYRVGLTVAQRDVVSRLLRLWSYYGNVYPKEAQVTAEPGCSKATFWRTIRLLEGLGLISVTNRYVIRPHAQISNRYRFDKLLLLIARYLAEHGSWVWGGWLKPYVIVPAAQFSLGGFTLPDGERPP